MKESDFMDTDTTNANLKLNEKLNDNEIAVTTDPTNANNQIQKAFSEGTNENRNTAPTYLYNNTPAIKINKNNN